MIDLPDPREAVGPKQLQDIQMQLEWIKDKMRMMQLVSSPTVRVTPNTFGTMLEATPGTSSSDFSIALYRVKEVYKDTMRCRTWSWDKDANDEVVGEDDIEIAKFLDLQPSYFNGKTWEGIQWEATSNGGTYDFRKGTVVSVPPVPSGVTDELSVGIIIDQMVQPAWVEDESIIAAFKVSATLNIELAIQDAVNLMEMPGRVWMEPRRDMSFCYTDPDTGVTSTLRALVRCSRTHS